MKLDLKVGNYIRTDKGFISQVIEFKEHYTKGKRLVTSSSVKEVDENYLSLKGNQCEFIESIDCSIPPCYPSDEEIEKIKRHIIKASDKLINLVEYMDLLVIENKVKDINNNEVYLFNPVRCDGFTVFENNQHCMIINMDYIIPIENIKIKQILTSEIFDQMSYKVGN